MLFKNFGPQSPRSYLCHCKSGILTGFLVKCVVAKNERSPIIFPVYKSGSTSGRLDVVTNQFSNDPANLESEVL